MTYPATSILFSSELEKTGACTKGEDWKKMISKVPSKPNSKKTLKLYGKVKVFICVWQKTNNSNELS